jgi:hypothetical protein
LSEIPLKKTPPLGETWEHEKPGPTSLRLAISEPHIVAGEMTLGIQDLTVRRLAISDTCR